MSGQDALPHLEKVNPKAHGFYEIASLKILLMIRSAIKNLLCSINNRQIN